MDSNPGYVQFIRKYMFLLLIFKHLRMLLNINFQQVNRSQARPLLALTEK